MSGTGYTSDCPNCGETMDCYSDHKPYDYVSGNCIHCGFYYFTQTGQESLNNLNAQREEYNLEYNSEEPLPLLKTLPELKSYLKPFPQTSIIRIIKNKFRKILCQKSA